jgi:malate dehydrogenase (oxaloacetate-decarboxylating)
MATHMHSDPTHGEDNVIETTRAGYELLATPLLNKGTAFTEAERDAFELHGLLPPSVTTLDEQVSRRMETFHGLSNAIEKYTFLRDLQDTNETLFYALLAGDLEAMLPIVYTPTVGAGCERFSHVFRKPRGVFLAWPNRDRIETILDNPRFDQVEVIVVTDGERILGLGDQGAGGMGIPIGKLSLYTACAGIHPATTLPILLDVGTDRRELLADPIYIGWRHGRIRGVEYDAFIERFVSAVTKRWPHVLLQWEDFAQANAGPLLERYRDRLCTFNDDIQGTAAVAVGALLSAINITGVPLAGQRIAVVGAGSAGCGISRLLMAAMIEGGLSPEEARACFYLVDRDGLLVQGQSGILLFQQPFAQDRARIAAWHVEGKIGLAEVVAHARPTVLIGVSGQGGAFTEPVIGEMARHVDRPVIFPLSNPTSRSEATPADLIAWTGGRAVIGTGSPFPPVSRGGRPFKVDQTNNAYIFPGVGLGALAVDAKIITDGMFMAAAKALAEMSPARQTEDANLLPAITQLREVAFRIAIAVASRAQDEGVAAAPCEWGELISRIKSRMWTPAYRAYRRAGAGSSARSG